MSTGIELIPLALIGLVHIAKVINQSLKEAERNGILEVDTRMTDKRLIMESLQSLGYEVIEAGQNLDVHSEDANFALTIGEHGAYLAQCDTPSEFAHVADSLVRFEAAYMRHLQASIVLEITQNAENLGYAVTQESLPNQAVRLSVKVRA